MLYKPSKNQLLVLLHHSKNEVETRHLSRARVQVLSKTPRSGQNVHGKSLFSRGNHQIDYLLG